MGLTQRVDRELRTRLPKPAYHLARRTYYDARKLAGRNPGRGRLLPDFLVIGTAKSGTTTLHGWLSEHPFVEPAVKKEVHFFDYDWYRGVDWYRQHFPPKRDREAFAREHGRPFLTGEASPTYISHEWAPGRIRKLLPHAKLIVAFRNPVDRAYSQFQMSRREQEEPLESFLEAVEAEEARLAPEFARSRADRRYNSWPLGKWSYLWRSRYADQLERWLELYPREQLHVLTLEQLAADPQGTMDDVHAFLGLPPHRYEDLKPLHTASYDAITPEERARLREYFAPHNERLYRLLGVDFGWQ